MMDLIWKMSKEKQASGPPRYYYETGSWIDTPNGLIYMRILLIIACLLFIGGWSLTFVPRSPISEGGTKCLSCGNPKASPYTYNIYTNGEKTGETTYYYCSRHRPLKRNPGSGWALCLLLLVAVIIGSLAALVFEKRGGFFIAYSLSAIFCGLGASIFYFTETYWSMLWISIILLIPLGLGFVVALPFIDKYYELKPTLYIPENFHKEKSPPLKKSDDKTDLLIDILCCFACADGEIAPQERELLYSIIAKFNADLSEYVIDQRVVKFFKKIGKSGFSSVTEQIFNKVSLINNDRSKQKIKNAVKLMIQADNKIDEKEIEVYKKFKKAIGLS